MPLYVCRLIAMLVIPAVVLDARTATAFVAPAPAYSSMERVLLFQTTALAEPYQTARRYLLPTSPEIGRDFREAAASPWILSGVGVWIVSLVVPALRHEVFTLITRTLPPGIGWLALAPPVLFAVAFTLFRADTLRAFRLPRQSPDALRDIWRGGILFTIPLFGWWLNLGYRITMVHKLLKGEKPWPGWKNYPQLLKQGAVIFAAMGWITGWPLLVAFLAPSVVVKWIAISVFLFLFHACPALMLRYCETLNLKDLFKPSVPRMLFSRAYWKAWMIGWAAFFTSLFGNIVPLFGFFLTTTWFYHVMAHNFLGVYRRSQERTAAPSANSPDGPTVLVIGGSGYFGRLLVEELLKRTGLNLIIGGRNKNRLEALQRSLNPDYADRIRLAVLDLSDRQTLEPWMAEVGLAICAAGPFQGLPMTLLTLCIARGVAYMDLADAPSYSKRVQQELRHHLAGTLPAIFSGWSTAPALTGLLSRIAIEGMSQVEGLRLQMAPGNKLPRNAGTVSSLLASVGQPFEVRRHAAWQTVRGGTEARDFVFPTPVGRQTGFLVDVPDHELFPMLFQTENVTFRAGSELALLNKAVAALAWLVRVGLIKDLPSWDGLLRRAMAVFGFLGHGWGAVGVEATGQNSEGRWIRRVSLVAAEEGQRMAVMPAVTMAAEFFKHPAAFHGLISVDDWLNRAGLEEVSRHWDFTLVVERAA